MFYVKGRIPERKAVCCNFIHRSPVKHQPPSVLINRNVMTLAPSDRGRNERRITNLKDNQPLIIKQ